MPLQSAYKIRNSASKLLKSFIVILSPFDHWSVNVCNFALLVCFTVRENCKSTSSNICWYDVCAFSARRASIWRFVTLSAIQKLCQHNFVIHRPRSLKQTQPLLPFAFELGPICTVATKFLNGVGNCGENGGVTRNGHQLPEGGGKRWC